MLRKTRTVLLIVIAIYFAVILLAFILQEHLIFFPAKVDRRFKYSDDVNQEEVFLQTPDHVALNGLFFPGTNDKVILYFHGNGGSLDSWQFVQRNFQHFGCSFFIIDYRGYGKSTGKISEQGLYVDAQTAFDYLRQRGFTDDKIIVFGRSLGTGVAVNLAINNKVGAVILESPFTSLENVATETFPFLFPSLYIRYHFDNLRKINRITAPLLIIHGTEDFTVPFSHGRKLYEEFHGQKTMIAIRGGTHNNLEQYGEFGKGVNEFLLK